MPQYRSHSTERSLSFHGILAGGPMEKGKPSEDEEEAVCTHSRMIDVMRTRDGRDTGQVRCVECGAVMDDPSPKG